MQSSNTTVKELQSLIKKMDINSIQNTVLPEFGMMWKRILYTVAITKQPMNAASVARVICKTAALSIPRVQLEEILGRLRFKVVATERRMWYAVRLQRETPPTEKLPVVTALNLPYRVANAMTTMAEVEALLIEDVLHWRVRILLKSGANVVHCCTTPGRAIALFSSLDHHCVLQGCVEALGYDKFEDANLHSEDIPSLLLNAVDDMPTHGPTDGPTNGPIDGLSDSPTDGPWRRDADEKYALSKREPAMLSVINEESPRAVQEMEKKERNFLGTYDDRYVEERIVHGRVDETLMLEKLVNLTIDSD